MKFDPLATLICPACQGICNCRGACGREERILTGDYEHFDPLGPVHPEFLEGELAKNVVRVFFSPSEGRANGVSVLFEYDICL
jgi:hypothetical protein